MNNFPDYVLVLEQQPSHDSYKLASLLKSWRSPFLIAKSTAQILNSVRDLSPCLVILIGNHNNWPHHFSRQLRVDANLLGYTILALTDATAPTWTGGEDPSIFDGFLVKPLSFDILDSILQAAQARRSVKKVTTISAPSAVD
ncbi:MAG: hypothetical protein VKJ64_08650 [Leptolyngbyaceae bacterium]|nr:hypothetical protein [Leptolyngbyaceae bacterium]